LNSAYLSKIGTINYIGTPPGIDVAFCSGETSTQKGITMADTIRVGIIGANPERSWALRAHIPALAALPQYTLQAVSTSRRESADAAAKKFNVPLAFDHHTDLVTHPDVDLVVVSVKVPYHHELVLAALEAGKAVFCEWPLGNGLKEAMEMAALARQKKVCTAVGLQARFAPVINRVRDLVAQGYVGTVLSTSVVGSGLAYGEVIERPNAYLLDKENGANLLTIATGHFLDAMCYCLGEFTELSATLATRRPQVKLARTDESLAATSPDQVAVQGTLRGGAVASFHFRGGQSRGTNLLWEINGVDGDLVVTGAGGHVQMLELTLQGGQGKDTTLAPLAIPEEYRWVPAETPAGFPFNVAQLYVQLASDLQKGTSLSLNFDAAVVRHRMIVAIQQAAETGERQTYLTET
jgi:predicted dehydrogenase